MPRARQTVSPVPQNDDDNSDGEEVPLKDSLKGLANKDPEFYQYLLENEKSLLDFDDDADEQSDDGDDDNDGGDGDVSGSEKTRVTEKLLSQWSEKLKSNDIKTIKCLIEAFRCAVAQAAGDEEFRSRYKTSPNIFNPILQSCFIDLMPALYRLLGLPVPGLEEQSSSSNNKQVNPAKCKNWKSITGPVKKYLLSLISVLNCVSDDKTLCSLLRHTLHMIPFIMCADALIKKFLRRVCGLWSQAHEEVRVLSFLSIVRLIRDKESAMIGYVIKKLYLTFVASCKLTTPETFPMIRFMQQSLVELYSLDQSVAYTQTFEFLRQSAVYLRSTMAATVKKDASRNIYNWGFVHSLILWQKVICSLEKSDSVRTLIFPYVQIVIGTIKLHPVSQYEPIRFHLIRSLVRLSESTDVFIPILPLIVNVLSRLDYSGRKKEDDEHQSMDLSCALKVSKKLVNTKTYRDAVVREVHVLLLDYLSTQSHCIGFPELVFPAVIKVKKFLKDQCRDPDDSKLMKQALEKIEENSQFIESHRKNVTFKFNDTQAVDEWESQRQSEVTPLAAFYEKWKALRKEHDIREFKKSGKKKNVSIPVEGDDDDDEKDEDAEPGVNGGGGDGEVQLNGKKKRSTKAALRDGTKKKKRKVNKAEVEKDRIRAILTKGMGEEDFKLSGIELSDDE